MAVRRAYNRGMSDVVFILVTVGFFALTVGFVQMCDRIVGRGEHEWSTDVDGARPEAIASPVRGEP